MLRYAIRRVLVAIPTLFGVSLLVFLVTTLLPEPAGGETLSPRLFARDPELFSRIEEMRRNRFLDLPRFFNGRPNDVRSRASDVVAHLAAEDAQAPIAARTLARLGGAALPHVLPRFDDLSPAARGRIAVALAPVAERMGIGDPERLHDPEHAAVFWQRFWDDRALDFTEPSVRRAVKRLLRYDTDTRANDVVAVDTFALEAIFQELEDATELNDLARLTSLAAHATGRGAVIGPEMAPDVVSRVLADWSSYWFVHRTDFVSVTGSERVVNTLLDTRYGKWTLGAATGELGTSLRDGQPLTEKLRTRAPITLVMTLLAMLLSFAIAIPLGAIAAWRRGHDVDVIVAFVLFALYSLPSFLVAQLFARIAHGATALTLALPVVTLALSSVAVLARHQRASMLDVIGQDYVRTAKAKGVSALRVAVAHVLRNATMPTVTLAGLQLPSLLGAAFVVEEVFGLPGLGWETLRAVEAHDGSWLIVVVLITAALATMGLIASEFAYGLLDPRVRERLGRRAGPT